MRRLLIGITSLIGLVLVLVGVPAALLVVGFNPARAGISSWQDLVVRLSMPDDGSLLSAILTLAAWLAWAYLAAAILVELVALIRHIPSPRIPVLNLGQAVAKQMVAGVAVLFIAAPLVGSIPQANASPITPPTAPPAATQTVPQTAYTAGDVAKPAQDDDGYKTVKVQRGDTLSGLAAEHLDDGHKWPRIFKASKSIEQPGGRRITDPDQIDIGQTVHIPTHKATPKPATTPDEETEQEQAETSTPAPAAEASTETSPPVAPPATAPAEGAATASSSVPEVMQAPATEAETDPVPMWATGAGVGTVVAAGVISLVAYRRRRQARAWRPGLRVPMPPAPVAATEQQLRAAAAPLSLSLVDHALRALSRDMAATGQQLPDVHAARLSAETFELYLTEPATLPAPWRGTADATVWLLDDVDAADLPDAEDLTEIPAPYPSLVTIGEDTEHFNVLLDLEHLGSLGLLGDTETAREALAALAIELAVSPWADDLTVTVVGAFSELEGSLQTGRVRYLPTIELALTELESRTHADHDALTAADTDTVHQARQERVAPSTWSPEIIIAAGELTDRHRNLLTNLVEAAPRVAIAAITGPATEPVGEWALQLHDDRTATLAPVGLTLTPQLVTAAAYSEMLHLVEIATYDDLIPAPAQDQETPPEAAESPQEPIAASEPHMEPSQPAPDAQSAAQPETATVLALPNQAPAHDQSVRAVTSTAAAASIRLLTPDPEPVPAAEPPADPVISVLGPVEIAGAEGPVEATKKNRLLEYATYLLLHPGAAAADIDDAIWPNRTSDDNTTTRNTMNSKLRRWLGRDDQDELYLPLNSYTLTDRVTSDWTLWRQLLGNDPRRAFTAALVAALKLVRGRPFAGTHPHRYSWAEPARQEMIGEIVEASYELARRRLMESDWRGVESAIVVALAIEPALEHLWRIRILAAHHSGDTPAFEEAKARLLTLTDELGLDLEPETLELLTDLTDNPQRAWEKAIAQ